MVWLKQHYTALIKKKSSHHSQIDSLDGLRGIAVLLVALSHMSLMGMHVSVPGIPALDFSGVGKFGVYLFFTLSAFLLSLPIYRRPLRDLNAHYWATYLSRRVMRIFPLLTLILAVSVVMTAIGVPLPFEMSPEGFWRHLTLRAGTGVLWSIPVEFKYYLLLPVVVILFAHVLRRNLLLSGVATIVLIAGARSIWPSASATTNSMNLGFYLPVFFLGSCAALLHYRLSDITLPLAARRGLELLALSCGAVIVLLIPSLLSLVTGLPFQFNRFHHAYTFFAALWCVFIVAHLHGVGWFQRVLCWGPLRLVGVVSFSFYLTHLPALRLVRKLPLDGAIWESISGGVALALTLGISLLLYTFIEKPFLTVGLGRKAEVRPANTNGASTLPYVRAFPITPQPLEQPLALGRRQRLAQQTRAAPADRRYKQTLPAHSRSGKRNS